MEFMLCLGTESRYAHNSGGSDIASDGVDLIASLFLYSFGNRTICGRIIYQYPHGIIGAA